MKKKEKQNHNNIGIIIKDAASITSFSYRKWDDYPKEKKNTLTKIAIIALIVWLSSFVFYFFSPNIHEFFTSLAAPITEQPQKWLLEHVPSLFDTLVCIVAYFSIFFVIGFIKAISRFKSQKTKTFCGLIFSIINYILFIVYFLLILAAWGANVAAIWASAGVLTLIIGFGAQSLVSDLFTGLVIAIEGNIEVGDTVFFENFNGTVTEIGLRVTKIEDTYNHIMIVRNSEIKEIVNTSKHVRYHQYDFAVSIKYQSNNVIKVLNDNIDRLKTCNDKIKDVRIFGVTKFDHNSTTYAVLFSCLTNSQIECKAQLVQEIRSILDENNIIA